MIKQNLRRSALAARRMEIGASVAALFSDKAKIGGTAFGVVSEVLVAMFGFMELVIRVPKRKAIARVEMGTNWDFTTIREAMREEAPRLPFAGFYVPVAAIVLVLAIAAASKRTESTAAQTTGTQPAISGGAQRPDQKTSLTPASSPPAAPSIPR